MVAEQATITTSVDSDLDAALAQAKELQEEITKLTAQKASETAEEERNRIDVIFGDFSSKILSDLKSDSDRIEALIALGCNGFSVGWKADDEGDGYLLSYSPMKVETAKAKTATSSGGGTQRDLAGMFEAVATPAQKLHLASLETNSQQYTFKNRVVTADDPASVAVPTA